MFYHYASKIQKDPTKSLIYDQREADYKHFNIDQINNDKDEKMTGRQKAVLQFSCQHLSS